MEAVTQPDGGVTLSISLAEAVVIHELIAFSEFSDDFGQIELRQPVDKKVMSDLQQALAPLIPGLGTVQYQQSVDRAYATVDPEPFGQQA